MYSALCKRCACKKYFQDIKRLVGSSPNLKDDCSVFDPRDLLMDSSKNYRHIMLSLLKQAHMSVLLHVGPFSGISSQKLHDFVHEFCSKRGNVISLTRLPGNIEAAVANFVVEFEDSKGVENLSVMSDNGFLLRIAKLTPQMEAISIDAVQPEKSKLLSAFKERIQNAENMSEQMKVFFEECRTTSANLRGKLLFGSVLGDFFNWHMNTSFIAVPFGTTVSGFAFNKSDLDISLTTLDTGKSKDVNFVSATQLTTPALKRFKNFERAGATSLFTRAGKEIDQYIKDLSHVEVVNSAIVPIMILDYEPWKLEIDVAVENRVGLKLSWTINAYARMEDRVGPFLFLVRAWAKQRNLAKHHQGEIFTPFMITCLGLFYLMRVNPPVIPPMSDLLNRRASNSDLTFGGIRYQIITDLKSIAERGNTSTLEDLFMGFLQYYSTFDFTSSINLTRGQVGPVWGSRVLITSPFSENLNIAKHVSQKCALSLKKECNMALRILESRVRRGRRNREWGLPAIYTITEDLW